MAPLAKGDMRITAELWSKDRYIVATGHEAARKKVCDTLTQNPQDHLIQVGLPEVFTERLGRFVDLQERPGMKVPVHLLRTYSGQYDAAPRFPVIVTIEM